MTLWPILLLSCAAVALGGVGVRNLAIRAETSSKRAVVDWLKSNPCGSCGGALARIRESDLSRALVRFRRTAGTGPAPTVWRVVCPDCGKELRVAERKGRAWRSDELEETEV